MLIIGLILTIVAIIGAALTYVMSHYNSVLDSGEAIYVFCILIMVL